MSKVMWSLGHQMRELIAEVLLEQETEISGVRLKELVERRLEDGMSHSTFWFHLNKLRESGVVRVRKTSREGGNPLRLSINKQIMRRELERVAEKFWLELES